MKNQIKRFTRQETKRALLTSVLLSLCLFCGDFFEVHAQTMSGIASFYSKKATGSRTANGERLHHDSMTCAHRTLPFGTLLRVTYPKNGKSVVVRVNDRGPYIRGRIVDLSWGAAKAIGILQKGIAKVDVEPAYLITIPLKAQPMKLELPPIKTDNLELPDTLRAIWQEDELIFHWKKKEMKKKKKKNA